MYYVMTVYHKESFRPTLISKYKMESKADMVVKICNRWGIGIDSCERIDESRALSIMRNGCGREDCSTCVVIVDVSDCGRVGGITC